MKKILLISSILISILMLSCSNVDPIIWNANIIDIYNETLDSIEDFQELISLETMGDEAVNKNITDKANYSVGELDRAIVLITDSEVPTDGEAYQLAVLDVLKSAKEQINIGLRFTEFAENTSELAVEKYADDYDTASSITAKKVDVFISAQADFALKAGFELE